jgi:hypothetical protein
MAKYRTAMGKVVDMTTLISRNEKVRAVGNMKVNARGDTIDSAGRIIKPVTAKVNEAYGKTVGNRGSHQVASKPVAPPKPKLEVLTEFEKELEASMEDDIAVEQIKEKEVKKQNEKTSVRSNKSQSNKTTS